MNDHTSQISNILNQVRLLKKKYDELAAVTGEQFNVFSILEVETGEVRTHSAFLADLLNPQGSHRQGAAFLKLFLGLDAIKNSESDEYKNLETFQVSKEAFTDQGRIDILLEKKDACIVIENKIYAEDQDAQMERYYQYATSKHFSKEQIKLVYLTLDGSPPSKESLGSLPEKSVKCLSYSKHIINWLDECMKLQEVQRIAPIREILFQYRDLLNELTGQSTNTRYSMELKYILEQDKNYELIPQLEKMTLEFKIYVQLEFWRKLTEIMNDKVDKSGIHDNQEKEASEDNIRHYYNKGGKNRLYLGTTFGLKIIWKQAEIAIRVELGDYSWISYGFVLFENSKRVKSCQTSRFNELAEKLDSKFKRDDKEWLGWKFPERDLKFPVDYPTRLEPCMSDLLDDKKREEAVEELVREIDEEVRNLKKELP